MKLCFCLQEDLVFAELVENVIVAIKYFNDRVESARQAGGWDWSVEKVLEVIKGAPSVASKYRNKFVQLRLHRKQRDVGCCLAVREQVLVLP